MSDDAGDVARDLYVLATRMEPARVAIVRTYGQLLQRAVRKNASKPRTGPPGPRIQTGHYVRSINLRTGSRPFVSSAEVGTNAPQGRRLEFGFSGTDSLGRRYDQPPYPHFRPALALVEPAFIAALRDAGLPHGNGPL